jgi:uncharacterized membrane protein
MILGMSVEAFTTLHVIISLVAIAAGLVVLVAMAGNRHLGAMTGVFLLTTILTSVTGFFFPLKAIGPPHIFGVISLVALAVSLFALYARKLAGVWRPAYIVTALLSLYLNCVVLVVQVFQKIPFFNAFAPTGSEPAFMAAQGVTLLVIGYLGFLALRRYRPVL